MRGGTSKGRDTPAGLPGGLRVDSQPLTGVLVTVSAFNEIQLYAICAVARQPGTPTRGPDRLRNPFATRTLGECRQVTVRRSADLHRRLRLRGRGVVQIFDTNSLLRRDSYRCILSRIDSPVAAARRTTIEDMYSTLSRNSGR